MSDPSEVGARVRVTTGEMAYGPHAVGRLDGKVLFVRGAAPDEEIDAVVTEARERFAFAEVAAVVRPSAARRPAPCPYLPRCGGCPWQHLDYAAQLAAKQSIVREHLRRIAGIDVVVAPILASPREYAYRRRIKLRVDGGVIGFHTAASHALVAIDHCLLAEPAVDAAIASAAALVRALRSKLRRVELSGAGSDDRVVLAAEVEGALADGDAANSAAWLAAHPHVAGLVLRGRGWSRHWGDLAVALAPEEGPLLTVHPPGFTQVNPAGNRLLVATVLAAADAQPGQRVLDLYAGAGNLSLPLRRRGALVTAVEQDRGAAADARDNAARASGPPMRVIADRAERALSRLVDGGEAFDLVVLDPPRSGAAGCMAELVRLRPAKILYVSCDPATLARDLRTLRDSYSIDLVQPIDLFPHTYHVETVVCATLSCEAPTSGVSSARRDGRTAPPRGRRDRRRPK